MTSAERSQWLKTGRFGLGKERCTKKTLINATLKRLIETSSDSEATGLYDEAPEVGQRSIEDAEIIQQSEPIIEQGEPTMQTFRDTQSEKTNAASVKARCWV